VNTLMGKNIKRIFMFYNINLKKLIVKYNNKKSKLKRINRHFYNVKKIMHKMQISLNKLY
jgi:hypothetical protein